jgi:SagB-type dehydrogenase family enzyme
MHLGDRLGTLAEEFHVASRNLADFKSIFSSYQVHYEPHVRQMMREAPLYLPDRSRVKLPAERARVAMSVDEAICQRVSGRNYGQTPVTAEQLATLLYLGNAVRRIDGDDVIRSYQRNAPNSGNLGSVEVYPVIMNVSGIEPGIYHYDSVRHDLAQFKAGQFASWLRECVLLQLEFSEAALALILTGAIGRLSAKYGLRGYRMALLDAGHVSENIYLVGTGLGLQVCATAGFIDDELDEALGLDGLETATLLVVLIGSGEVQTLR